MASTDIIPTPLSKTVIIEGCAEACPELEVHVLDSVDSTNTWLLDGDFSAPVSLCAAEHQTVGRGRRGKTWYSPNSGVTFSLRFNRTEPVAWFNGLSLIVGSVLCDTLRDTGVVDSMVKWPNDVLVRGSKLAGILVESRTAHSTEGTVLVVGMGVNYILGGETRLIDQPSTGLSTLCGVGGPPDRSELIADIAKRLITAVSADIPQSVSQLADRWTDYDALAGTTVVATVAGDIIEGLAAGIDEKGNLQIDTKDGLQSFNSADVSVRKNF